MRAFLAFPLLLVGCGLLGPDYGPETDGITRAGLSVEVAAREVARGETLETFVVNTSPQQYATGACYLVERWDDGEWGRRDDDNGPCILPLIHVESGTEVGKSFVAHIEPGTIRLVEQWQGEVVLVASPSIRVTR